MQCSLSPGTHSFTQPSNPPNPPTAPEPQCQSYDCRNHIKVIERVGRHRDKLYVCGTNAYNPRDYLIHASNLSQSSELIHGIGASAQAECPFDPDDNSTAAWVESGNPSDLPALYSGTVTEASKADAIIFRSELYNQSTGLKVHEVKRTTKYDSKTLDSEYSPCDS